MDFMQKNHYNRLTRRMTEYFFSEDTCRNTFFSPLSILVLLAVAAESTAGDTRVEILKLLRDYQGTNEFGRTLAGFQKSISRGDTFSSANAVCIRSDLQSAVHDGKGGFAAGTGGRDSGDDTEDGGGVSGVTAGQGTVSYD